MSGLRIAIATPSFAGDLERCRLLCDSIDRFLTGYSAHYLLVEDADLPLFRPLEGPRRHVIPESALLPDWLRPHTPPFGGRRLWTGPRALLRGVPPLRGWHAQQLRKLALARVLDEDAFAFADSDMVFVRPFALSQLVVDGALHLHERPGGTTADMADHVAWSRRAAALVGLPAPVFPSPDYITNLVSWRADTARALLDHVEAHSGRDWVSAIARRRAFSEYEIYGYFARSAHVPAALHRPDPFEYCKVYWTARDGDPTELSSFEEVLAPGQVAVAVQSFLGHPVARIRALYAAQSDTRP